VSSIDYFRENYHVLLLFKTIICGLWIILSPLAITFISVIFYRCAQ
jgi:hypothetical protein